MVDAEANMRKIPLPEMSSPPCAGTVTVRRNPPRRARPTPSTTAGRNSASSAAVRSIPIADMLSLEVPAQTPSFTSDAKNLNVFLRIKPLGAGIQRRDMDDIKIKARNVWPQNPSKIREQKEKSRKKKTAPETCITVNSSTSVTLSPPVTLQESKRIRAESYEGFSHVFSAESTQSEVYKRMVEPLVADFLTGTKGMLAALGPSGSGKTHTVFGTPREPGIVPLALRQILTQRNGRLFYLSMFEISSERGRGEKVFDLSSGAELVMQQSAIRGLQEVAITNVGHAESLIASGMLKRATAMTNTNSQSSRSQCIINIRSVYDGEADGQLNSATLTFVDIAGAEREKRTGNQGERLQESNFINNTSMVFSLCLRSLLEHQRTKKPLQKHFQSSLLTRYLRDYLEGKKRMSLILTVKPEEEDYIDTSYVLRQASPFMKIVFNNVEESSISLGNKRQIQKFSRVERPKKMKVKRDDASMEKQSEVGKVNGDDCQTSKNDSRSELDTTESECLESATTDSKDKDRQNQIMLHFSRAMWKVLKQSTIRIKVSESEIQTLKENLANEKARSIELEKELKSLKASCTCTNRDSINVTYAQIDHEAHIDVADVPGATETSSSVKTEERLRSAFVDKDECNRSCNEWQTPIGQTQIKPLILADSKAPFDYVEKPNNAAEYHCLFNDTNTINEVTEDVNPAVNDSNPTSDEQTDEVSYHHRITTHAHVMQLNIRNNEGGSNNENLVYPCMENEQDFKSISGLWFSDDGGGQESDATIDKVAGPVNDGKTECQFTNNISNECSERQAIENKVEHCGEENLGGNSEPECLKVENLEGTDICASFVKKEQQLLILDKEDEVLQNQPSLVTEASKSVDEQVNNPKPEKPRRRRLAPAPSLLIRDVSFWDIEEEIEKPKKGTKGALMRTQGSAKLLELLAKNQR